MTEVKKHSIGELVSELSEDIKRLFRDEIELARIELSEKVLAAGRDALMIAAGGAVLAMGCLVLLACIVAAISLALPLWLSALIVGISVSAIGAALVMKSISDFRKGRLRPSRTISSLKQTKEEAQWLKKQI